MLNSSQFTRSAVLAATVISFAATPATARQADTSPPPKAAATTTAHGLRHPTQPRVDGIGVRPLNPTTTASPARPVPAAESTDSTAGRDWLLIPFGALALSLMLILAAARSEWRWVHPFGGRHA